MSIHILDNNLINKIAAGEVVERPASVVKELVENSLDAGADFIIVEIKNGGIDLIEVVDNGKGMNKEDVLMCVKRHATSKISSIEDLYNIMTYGFRGEALAAISSVSKFSVQTKEIGAVVGTVVRNDSNMNIENVETRFTCLRRQVASENNFQISDVGCSEGTKIRVENLFYNIPARRKFLKSAATEFGHILNTVVNVALVNYRVRFKFIHNGKVIFDYQKYTKMHETEHENTRNSNENEWEERVKIILGSENFSNMMQFYQETGEMIIQGFVDRPETAKTNKPQQYLFVNSRPVYNNIVHKAIYEGYRNLISANSHPCFIIKLDLEPELVDVNVHPRKMEVKFLRQQEVFKIVQAAVREVAGKNFGTGGYVKNGEIFNSFNSSNKISNFKSIRQAQDRLQIPKQFQNSNFKFQNLKREENNRDGIVKAKFQSIQRFNDAMFKDESATNKENLNWKLVGQVNNLYLIVEKVDGLVLIDQHAAHERMLYDKLIKEAENRNFKKQQFLVPLKIELSINEMNALKRGLAILENIGFEIEESGVNTIIVQTVHSDIAGKDIEKILRGIISEIFCDMALDLKVEEKMIEVRDKTIKYISCHSAVRGGDIMTREEQSALAEKVLNGEIKSTCPHGRPIMAIMSWEEIGKKFKRINC